MLRGATTVAPQGDVADAVRGRGVAGVATGNGGATAAVAPSGGRGEPPIGAEAAMGDAMPEAQWLGERCSTTAMRLKMLSTTLAVVSAASSARGTGASSRVGPMTQCRERVA